MGGSTPVNSRTVVEDVFVDYKGRRAGLIKALTADVEEFVRMSVCLCNPAEEVPPELPEPVLGINFVRDGMQENDWLSLVSAHSDAWLLSIAYYFGARFGFDKSDSTQSCHLKHILHMLQLDVVTETSTAAWSTSISIGCSGSCVST
ncbi:PHD finger protein ALFIN-LIKE 9-like isoform X2 [Impatiens glandulifera]|uniref:PHD finger protein ALFIN-LIKE 9-like isoform X2 n=1 Tax=Impatiens glandulifera TaxID=253017 RepID=UPI001FB19A6B|nr:PHD finger protein ALFIN-LIKE 9-like isoform X2 [Impatiens glandulifera]